MDEIEEEKETEEIKADKSKLSRFICKSSDVI